MLWKMFDDKKHQTIVENMNNYYKLKQSVVPGMKCISYVQIKYFPLIQIKEN